MDGLGSHKVHNISKKSRMETNIILKFYSLTTIYNFVADTLIMNYNIVVVY